MADDKNRLCKKVLLHASIAALLVFVVYVPSLTHGFVNLDDPGYVYESAFIRSIDPRLFFTSFIFSNWHPLTILSYAIDYSIWGLNPTGYHLTNNLLHAINTSLVFVLAVAIFPPAASSGREGAWTAGRAIAAARTRAPFRDAAALLFGLHPQHVESVSWVSERKDVLCGFFFILCVIEYLRYARTGRAADYVLTLLLAALALMSKPMAVSLPVVLLIADFYPLKRIFTAPGEGGVSLWRAVVEKIPFAVLSVLVSIARVMAQAQDAGVRSLDVLPLAARVPVAVNAYAFYLYKALLPFGLIPLYRITPAVAGYSGVFIVSAATLAVLSAVALVTARKRGFAAAWVYYLVTLVPVVGVVKAGGQFAADRYMYLPSIGLFLFIGWFAGGWFAGGLWATARRGSYAPKAGAAFVLALFAAMTFLTVRQQAVWKDSITLWSPVIRKYPAFAAAYGSRALGYEELGRRREALADYSKAIELDPGSVKALNNRGNLYLKEGRFDDAARDFVAAIRIDPGVPTVYYNLSRALSGLGETGLALEAKRKAQELERR
ncbi:MAG: tetratricopeptide repeat protein [Thermodesulfobacteriota bacterium]